MIAGIVYNGRDSPNSDPYALHRKISLTKKQSCEFTEFKCNKTYKTRNERNPKRLGKTFGRTVY